ncbi:MAG: hypothetical protein QXN59_00410 [Candidatus Micrarchaeaceae archaeon]
MFDIVKRFYGVQKSRYSIVYSICIAASFFALVYELLYLGLIRAVAIYPLLPVFVILVLLPNIFSLDALHHQEKSHIVFAIALSIMLIVAVVLVNGLQ